MADDLSGLRIEKSPRGSARRRHRGAKAAFLSLAALVVVLCLVLLYRAGLLAPSVTVQAATVTRVYPSQTFTLLNASGYVVAQRKSAISTKVTGRLIWLGVEEGSRVKAGQVIAKLENDDVTASRAQAEANLRASRFTLDQAKAELADATLAFNRAKGLVARKAIPQADHDSALARYKKADAGVAAAEATVNSGEAALRGAEVAVEYTFIRAPFNAVVLTKSADVGDIITPIGAAVNAKAAVVTVADMDSLKVEADVSEANLELVRVGQPCEIQLDALPESRFRGRVHMIVPTADRSKATVMVKVGFVDEDPRILPEMSAKVAFLSRSPTAAEKDPRTAVARSAVAGRNNRTVVFAIRQGKAVETPVTVGGDLGDMVEVRTGVKAGEQVVVNPPARLRDGSRVSVAVK
jgi:RND family efflux transporter MFP subunit